MRVWLTVMLLVLGLACSEPAVLDAGSPDAGPPGVDLELSAEADPEERTDCTTDRPAPGEVRAKHVVCAAELVEGSLAMGRVGDIVIENARARFIIRTGDGSASTIGAPPGGVIDAALLDGPDLLKEIFPSFDFASMTTEGIAVVGAGGDGEARVRVLFRDAPIALLETVIPGLVRPVGVRGTLDYVLRAGEDALEIQLGLTTTEGASGLSTIVGVLGLVGGMEMLQPGVGVLSDDNLGGAGLELVGERADGAMALTLERETGTLTHIETIQWIRGDRVAAVQGELTTVLVRLGLGETAASALSAARVTGDPVLTLTGAPGDRVRVSSRDDAILLQTRFDGAGEAAVALPAGDYRVTAGFDRYFEAAPAEVTHDAAQTVAVSAAPAATLIVAASVELDPSAPVRVTVERDGEALERFVAEGETPHRLPPGDYRVTVSHGLEHDVSVNELTLVEGVAARLEPDLPRVIETDGWVSVDLHLHSDLSTDSVHAVEDAVRMLAAEGVQAAAATDHDYITDYAAVGRNAGVGSVLLVSGVEVSTTVFGHINGYPLRRTPERSGAGAPVWFDMSPAEVFGALRAQGDDSLGGALVQINHPRYGGASFFGSLGLDADSGRATRLPSDLGLPDETDLNDFGFEVLEIFNGCCRSGDELSFEDYLALYSVGRRFTMVGNSDSHQVDRPPGTPRSFVRVPDEADFDWPDVAAGLRAGQVTVAAAAFVRAERMGDRVGDTVPVRIEVQAPPWAEVDRLRVFAGRVATVDRVIPAGGGPVLFDEVVDVPLGGADFVLVRVDGANAPEPMQRFGPLGVTNPLPVP